jgi:TRAP-type C4-dicarboxylate transport system substrate-binding protein
MKRFENGNNFYRAFSLLAVTALIIAWASAIPTGVAHASKAKPVLFKYANVEPPPSVITKAFKWWAAEIEKRTGGRLKIEVYDGATLAPPRNVIEAVRVGMADCGQVVTVFNPGKTPLATVSQNPIGGSDIYVNHMALQDLVKNFPPYQKEFEKFNQKAFMTQATGTQRLIAREPLDSIEVLKGMKIRATAQLGTFYKKLGAASVFIPMPETYEGLQRGTAEGASAGLVHIRPLRFYEVCKHLLMVEDIGVSNAGVGTINLNQWKKLPVDVQEVVLEVSDEFAVYLSKLMIEEEERILDHFKASGVKIYELSPADKKRMIEVGKEVTEEWVKDLEKKGLPARATLDAFLKAMAKYQAEVRDKGYPWQ